MVETFQALFILGVMLTWKEVRTWQTQDPAGRALATRHTVFMFAGAPDPAVCPPKQEYPRMHMLTTKFSAQRLNRLMFIAVCHVPLLCLDSFPPTAHTHILRTTAHAPFPTPARASVRAAFFCWLLDNAFCGWLQRLPVYPHFHSW
jgi:hypothetical protein